MTSESTSKRATPADAAPANSLTALLSVPASRGDPLVAQMKDGRGCELLSRAVLAAMAESHEHELRSLHATFLRPAPAGVPLRVERDELASGRSLARWRVRMHDESPVFDATVALALRGEGLTFQVAGPPRDLPDPESLPSEMQTAIEEGWAKYAGGAIETRRIDGRAPLGPTDAYVWRGWVRPREPLPADASVHAAALAYLSDYRTHWGVERRLGAEFPSYQFLSLDHSLWAHRAERWDDWWLFETRCDVASGGHAFIRREVYSRDARWIASVGQEAIVRKRA